jgi:magnesium transporter
MPRRRGPGNMNPSDLRRVRSRRTIPCVIIAWIPGEKGLERHEVAGEAVPERAIWLDAVDITPDEEKLIERLYGLEVPTREEMQEIEMSSRLYRQDHALYMTSTFLTKTETELPEKSVVTFIFTKQRLITLRYADLWSFKAFCSRACRAMVSGHMNAESVLIGITEATLERLADMLERLDAQLEACSNQIFLRKTAATEATPIDLQEVMYAVGRVGNALSKIRESLVDKHRMVAYARTHAHDWLAQDAGNRLRVLSQDSQSLADQASFIAQKVAFLLDATLGLINIDQNKILKIFSVVTVIFTPPILIAGIYGMNLRIPEAHWQFGYAFALLLMAASAGIPIWIFKKRGWL